MATNLKITVNGKAWPVASSPDTPLLYVLTNELHLHGPRFGCGLAQCGSCSVLADDKEIRSCVTPVATVADRADHDTRGPAGLVRAQERPQGNSGAASAAAGVHRRAGSPLRLLLQRHDHQRRRAPGQ